jgi:hypothetical protein
VAFRTWLAEGLITLDELKVKLAGLEELRETARWELDALSRRREKIEELERDKDALLESYVGMVPEALDSLTPEEHHYVYKILRLRVTLRPDAPPEVSGMFGGTSMLVKQKRRQDPDHRRPEEYEPYLRGDEGPDDQLARRHPDADGDHTRPQNLPQRQRIRQVLVS